MPPLLNVKGKAGALVAPGKSPSAGDIMESNDKAAYFDSQAGSSWASQEYTPEELLKIERMLSAAAIREGMRVLEPGCGTGRLTEILAERVGLKGHVSAMDISPAMVAAARKRLEGRANVTLLCSRLEDLVLAREFDLAVCHQVFPHFEDKAEALRHMASSLKPSGKVVIFHLIGSAVINDHHRKAHPAVVNDTMPNPKEMAELFASVGMDADLLWDDEEGYLLMAKWL